MEQDPIQLLRQMYQAATNTADAHSRSRRPLPAHMVDVGEDLPPVARAPMYRPQTEVVGSPDVARSVDRLFTQVPDMRGRATKIIHGPNETVFNQLRYSGFGDNDYAQTNLNGNFTFTGPNKGEVTINPRLIPGEENEFGGFASTLAHEMGHAAGLPEDSRVQFMASTQRPGTDARILELVMNDLPAPTAPKRGLPEPLGTEAVNSDPQHLETIFKLLQRNFRR